MGQLQEFELAIKKTGEVPLTYEALIPSEFHLFQDVRRYQTKTAHLDVQVINIDGCITLDPEMTHVPLARLTSAEKKEFIEYLKLRVKRGDNIGSLWAFFRPGSKSASKALVAFGANIVHKDAATGQERARNLLKTLQKSKASSLLLQRSLKVLFFSLLAAAILFGGYKYGFLAQKLPFKKAFSASDTAEMKFYEATFPKVHEWLTDDGRPTEKKIAQDLLEPEFISDLLTSTQKDFYSPKENKDNNSGQRLILFVYFNYNTKVTQILERHSRQLEGTEFMRLARIYSTDLSGYSSNIFYFKVGDLDLRHSEISNFMKENNISYRDYTKLRDANAFSELLEKDGINYKMKNFLEDVYTFTPLKLKESVSGVNWYLLTQATQGRSVDFAAFFHRKEATLVPRRIGDALLQGSPDSRIAWYSITEDQADALKLGSNSLVYFSKTAGQALKLDIIADKIQTLDLELLPGHPPVGIHRELLMGDSKGKYGIRSYDPITSLVLSNLITKSSFERENNVSLKRDPIQVNTTLIQLSKDDSFSTQSITITPGKTGIVKLFENRPNFKARFPDGEIALFERVNINLFNPFTFMVLNDSITFSFKHEITDMRIIMGDKQLQIVKSSDGNHQILRIN